MPIGVACEVIIESAETRFTLYTFEPGSGTPWHFHSNVSDWYICQEGELTVATHSPESSIILMPAGMANVPAGTVHRTVNNGKATCRFALIQGTGAYDFNTVNVAEVPTSF
ncbi:MAG: cupin domain-containing protein [Sphingomonadales bacterium]